MIMMQGTLLLVVFLVWRKKTAIKTGGHRMARAQPCISRAQHMAHGPALCTQDAKHCQS